MRQLQGFRTQDSALAYYVNQLENLDRRLYLPLVSVTWGRDIKLRSGITMADQSTSFIQSQFAGSGTLANSSGKDGGNMPWLSAEANALQGVSVNGQKLTKPLRLLGREVSYTSVELERSQLTGQPIDAQKLDGLNQLYQMNTDQMVYIGSSDVGATGLVNDASVTSGSVDDGASGSPLWVNKTPAEILADVNELLTATWEASGLAFPPRKLLLPASNFSYISSQLISSAGDKSILKYILENNLTTTTLGSQLEIVPVKWLKERGANSTNRMVAYTNEEMYVRYPMVPIRRETPYYQGIRYSAPYIWAFGEMEIVYPETIQYRDGI